MNQNIFVKNKYNPDLETKYNNIKNERNNISISQNNIIYNPITNIIPKKINNQKDLLLNIEQHNDKIDNLLNNIKNERKNQDNIKPISSKIISNISNTIPNSISNSFEDLKKPYINKPKSNNDNNVKVLLKDLGLLLINE
jgi:hypothetical protein